MDRKIIFRQMGRIMFRHMPIAIIFLITYIFLGFLSLHLPVHAGDGTQIDWVNGYITATGYGTAKKGTSKAQAVISSTEAGRYLAMRNLLEAVKGVYIDSKVMVSEYIVEEDVIRARVEGLLTGAQVIDTKTTWEDGVPITAVTMRICMSTQGAGCKPGNTLLGTLPMEKFGASPLIPKKEYSQDTALQKPSKAPKGYPQNEASQKTSKVPSGISDLSYEPSKPATGVIFSLQGHAFRRVVLPVVVTIGKDGDMSTVYSVKSVEPKIVRTYGIVRYADTLYQAKTIENLGDNILIIPIERVTDNNVLVISTKSAQNIFETTMHGNDYLRRASVAVSSE